MQSNNARAVIDWNSLNRSALVLKTSVRPEKTYLYLHCLLPLSRRRSYALEGRKKATEKCLTRRTWASPRQWTRRSVVRAFRIELRDTVAAALLAEDKGVKDSLSNARDEEYDERWLYVLDGLGNLRLKGKSGRRLWRRLREDLRCLYKQRIECTNAK